MHLIANEPETGEDGLVELAAHVRGGAEVQPVRVGRPAPAALGHVGNYVAWLTLGAAMSARLGAT